MGSEGHHGSRGLRSAEAECERRGHGVADAVPDEPIPLQPRLGISRLPSFKVFISRFLRRTYCIILI